MSTEFNFNNKKIIEPGSYSQIKSGIVNPALALSYGNVLIIDTGSGGGYSSGPGVSGTLSTNKDSIQRFSDVGEFRDVNRGGLFWKLVKPLFKPGGLGINGISRLSFIKAAETVPAEINFRFGDASFSDLDAPIDGGSIDIQCKNEGLAGNGKELNGVLTKGYASIMKAGDETGKYVLEFYAGTFKGLDSENEPWDFVKEEDTTPELVATSSEFSTVDELVEWMKVDFSFNKVFKLKSYSSLGTGIYKGRIQNQDLVTYSTNNLAKGGTETYNTTHFNSVLEAIKEEDYTFILADNWGVDLVKGALSANNLAILSHLLTEAKHQKYLVVGGGKNRDEFNTNTGSVGIAETFDSARVIVVHAGRGMIRPDGSGNYKEEDSIFKAAAVLGRICGLEPQVPVTFKNIEMDSDLHNMTEKERVLALKKGVLHTKFDDEFQAFTVNQGINSLQNNRNLVNEDATSHEIAVERISAQLNKEIAINAKRDLLGNEDGVNRNTISPTVVEQWLKGYLGSRVANAITDNLILSFKDIKVTIEQDAYKINYSFVPNFPVNKLFFTGLMLDENLIQQ